MMIEPTELVLAKFREHLMGSATGNMKKKQANKELNHLRVLFETCEITDPFSIGETSVLNSVEEDFINERLAEAERQLKSSTVRNHLSSLYLFARYLFLKEVSPAFRHEQFDRIKLRKEDWFRSLNKIQKQEATEYRAKEEDLQVTPMDFQNYHNCERAKEARAILANEYEEEKMSKRMFCRARDYVLTEITFRNGARASGICGLTEEEFLKAQHMPNSNNYVMKVTKHKTSATKGAVHLCANPELFADMQNLNRLRKLLPGGVKTEKFFVTSNGAAMTTNSAPRVLTEQLRLGGFEHTANNTKSRKLTTSMVNVMFWQL